MATKKATKKTVKTTVKKPSKKDIEKALGEIADAKLAEAGVKPTKGKTLSVDESVKVCQKIDEAIMEMFAQPTSEVTSEMQPIFNTLTRMYEASEDNYQNVKYNKEKDVITVSLDSKMFPDLNKEVERIKTQVCCDTLVYNGMMDNENNRLMIIVRKK